MSFSNSGMRQWSVPPKIPKFWRAEKFCRAVWNVVLEHGCQLQLQALAKATRTRKRTPKVKYLIQPRFNCILCITRVVTWFGQKPQERGCLHYKSQMQKLVLESNVW